MAGAPVIRAHPGRGRSRLLLLYTTNNCGPYQTGRINTVSNGMRICGNSNDSLPSGYVITANFQVSSCGQYLGGRLNVAYNGIIACADSPTPPGYWVSANGIQSSACSPYQAERLNNS
ncbi:hypothetical protein [Streptomyces griseofuscus]|nr:hypothetical protein [Streptomyces griseofuscus]